jgi:hypothetical protein
MKWKKPRFPEAPCAEFGLYNWYYRSALITGICEQRPEKLLVPELTSKLVEHFKTTDHTSLRKVIFIWFHAEGISVGSMTHDEVLI